MATKSTKRKTGSVRASSQSGAASKTLRIPITNVYDGNDYSATILIGSENVAANVILDTGSSTLAVVPSVYSAAVDKAMQPTSLAQEVQYGTGAWVGPVVNTTLQIGDPPIGAITLPSAPIAITEVQTDDDFTGVDGIMGLAYLALNDAWDLSGYLTAQGRKPPLTFPWPFPATSFASSWKQFQNVIKNPGVKHTSIDPYFSAIEEQHYVANKFAFYTLRSWVRNATTNQSATAADPWNNGYFVLGGGEAETDLYSGDFVDVDVLDDIYYNVKLLSVQVEGCAAVKAKPLQAEYVSSAGTNCIVDTGTNPLVLANDVFQAIIESLQKLNPSFVSIIRHAQQNGIASTMLHLAQWPAISFILQGANGKPVKLSCSPQTYWQQDYPSPGQSVFQISAAGARNTVNQSILGLPLMNNYYTVFDRSQGAGNGIIRFAPIKLPS